MGDLGVAEGVGRGEWPRGWGLASIINNWRGDNSVQ